MAITVPALVVEDERSWSEVYERALWRVGVDRVEVADTYQSAATAIDAMRFAVAVVDIGLAVDDDRNVDGLRVMEKIRVVGDPTSIIVVTGRSGRDVVPIIRDSIKKFGAYDTIAKNTLVPAELRSSSTGVSRNTSGPSAATRSGSTPRYAGRPSRSSGTTDAARCPGEGRRSGAVPARGGTPRSLRPARPRAAAGSTCWTTSPAARSGAAAPANRSSPASAPPSASTRQSSEPRKAASPRPLSGPGNRRQAKHRIG